MRYLSFKKKPVVVIWLAIYSFLLLFIQNIAPFLNGFDPPTSFPGSSPIEPPWPTVANRGHGGRLGEDPGNEVFDLPANSS